MGTAQFPAYYRHTRLAGIVALLLIHVAHLY
jgi:hypothetical protein